MCKLILALCILALSTMGLYAGGTVEEPVTVSIGAKLQETSGVKLQVPA